MSAFSDAAIINGLRAGGYDDEQLSYVKEALAVNPWIDTDDDAEHFAQNLVTFGSRQHCETVLGDFLDSTVEEITGCSTGEELFDLYYGAISVDTSHLWEIYEGDNDTFFVLSVA